MINPQLIKPVTVFDCRGMIRPLEITKLKIKTKVYFYTIYCRNRLVKYGISYGNNEPISLDRIYRQLGHLSSFREHRLTGNSDITFRETEQSFLKQYGIELDHNDVTVELEMFDGYPFVIKPKMELENYESSKIQAFVQRYGFRPPGNPKILNHNRSAISPTAFNNLFEVYHDD